MRSRNWKDRAPRGTVRGMPPSKCISFQFDGIFEIPRVKQDASAITIHPDTGNLWTVTDDDIRLVEFTPKGEFVREVELIGFEDAEGLCHVDGERFLLAEEKRMCITVIDVTPGATRIEAGGRCIPIDVKSKKNKGLEGVSYDAKTDTLFTVREDKPPAVYRVRPVLEKGESETEKCPLDLDGFKDLSDTFFDTSTGWLWLLSHESHVAAAFDSRGHRIVEVKLKKGHNGLPHDIVQAEGIVRDRNGMLYICSEPNLIYRFRPEIKS